MNKKQLIKSFFIASCTLFITSLSAIEKNPSIGVVDFSKCIMESKYGKVEQKNFDALRMQMQKALEDLDGQMKDTATKLQDKDFLDSLSPDAEKELKVKFQTLGEEVQRYQGQYYQIIQQANMKVVQTMNELINDVAKFIAKKDHLSLILNKESIFHCEESLDLTNVVISELDKKFDKEGKKLDNSKEALTQEK